MTTPSFKPIQLKEHSCSQGHYGDIVQKIHEKHVSWAFRIGQNSAFN